MEKNGRLEEGAPSVVSGAKSDDVAPDGEPIVHGEKSASFRDAERPAPVPDLSAAVKVFDTPRA